MGYWSAIIKKNSESFFSLLRGQDWWFYKIPPLLAITYTEILTQDISPQPSFATLLALTVSMFFVAAYGHVVNDIFDIEVDNKAGKPNRTASLSRGQRTGLTLGLAVLGLMPWWWIGFNVISGILLATIYLLLTVYPAPPLRLKERFILGAIADAATVHAVPTLLVAVVFSNLANSSSPNNNWLVIIATSWAFAVGIRGILLHQMWDRDNDLKSGIQTLATKFGVEKLRFWIDYIIFPLEVILSSVFVLIVAQSAPLFLVPCAAYCLMLLLIVQDEFNPSPPEKSYIVLHDFYEVWLPLSLLILLSLHQPIFLILLGVHIALFYPAIQQRVLVSIRQIKLKLVKMNSSQSSTPVDTIENQPRPKTFLSQPVNDLERSLVRAIEFLRNNQLEDGEFPTYGNDSLSQPDSSPFVTALVLYSLSFLAADDTHSKVKPVVEKGLKFLVQAMEPGGLWRYWSSKNDRHTEIPPDLDDICCISHLLKLNNLPVPKNRSIILGNRNKEGLFYTWVLPRSIPSITLNCITLGKALSHSEQLWQQTDKDDICCVVNANVLLCLGETAQTERSLKYVIDTVLSEEEEARSAFYNHELSFYYMLSRAYFNGVTTLGTVKTPVIAKVSSLQKADGSFGNELLTALATCTLLNFNHIVPSLDKAIQFLLNAQQADGSWQRIPMYGVQPNRNFFGSEALTTGFCVEALARYRLLNLPTAQPETLTTLTPPMQKELEENGYVILDRFLNKTELQNLRDFNRAHSLPADIADSAASITCLTSNLEYRQKLGNQFKKFAVPKLNQILPNYRFNFSLWFRKKSYSSDNKIGIHQDPSFTDESKYIAFGIWSPLNDVNLEGSCLHVVKGSHKLNSNKRSYFISHGFPYGSDILSCMRENYLTPIPLKAGQAILFDKRLLHGSPPNYSDVERVAATGFSLIPKDAPLYFCYRESEEASQVQLYEVKEDFYDNYIWGEKPQGDGVKLIKTEPYTYDRLTPELIAEKLDPLHPDRAIPRLKTQLAETRSQLEATEATHQQTQAELEAIEEQYRNALLHFQDQAKQHFEVVQTELQQTHSELQQTQTELQQTHSELEDLKTYLQQTQGIEGQLNYYHHRIASQPDNLELYKEALTLQPEALELRLQFGEALVRQNRIDEAIATYQTALENQPHWTIYLALGQALTQAQRHSEAMAAYGKAQALHPGDRTAHLRLGDALAAANHLPAASEHYRCALDLQLID